MLDNLKKIIQGNKAVVILFMAVLAMSFCFHVYNRNRHFQELDSNGVYYVLNNFPYSAMNALNLLYPSSGFKPFKSLEATREFFNKEQVDKNLQLMLGSKYNEKKEMIIAKVYEGKPLFFYARSAEVIVLSKIARFLPPPVFAMLVLPFSSTYSLGPGFLYGFLGVHGSYDSFMGLAVALNQIIFHLSVLMMFLLLLMLGKKNWTAFTVCLFVLFSFSLYSYGYHLGSTVWNIFVSAAFMLAALYFYKRDDKNILFKLSVVSSVLLIFSYLVAFYWLAAMLALLFIDKKSGLKIFSKGYLLKLVKSQWIFIVCIIAFVLFILPPGQGYRGNPHSLMQLFQFAYYIILNFFSFFTKNHSLQILQFIIFTAMMVAGLYLGYRSIKDRVLKFIYIFVSFLLVIFCVAAVFGILSFIPSRHILFLVPALMILLYFCLDAIYSRLPNWSVIIIALAIIVCGFYSVGLSQKYTYDQTALAQASSRAETVVVFGDNYQLLYRFSNSPKSFIKKNNLPLSSQISPNVRYLYVSQSFCFDDLMADAGKEGMIINIFNKLTYLTGQKFIAFDPESFAFNYMNNYCQAEFIWVK